MAKRAYNQSRKIKQTVRKQGPWSNDTKSRQMDRIWRKNSKYFFNLEKSHSLKKAEFRLRKGTDILTDQENILNELKNFYSQLYTSNVNSNREADINKFFDSMNLLKLDAFPSTGISDNDSVTEAQCIAAMKDMPNHKSPGSDGLPVDFYKFFWKQLSKPFLDAAHYSRLKGKFSKTQNEGLITPIPTPNRDTLDVANYRPITLLNSDYKIVAKVLAHKIKNYLQYLLHVDQNGFTKGRYIGDIHVCCSMLMLMIFLVW